MQHGKHTGRNNPIANDLYDMQSAYGSQKYSKNSLKVGDSLAYAGSIKVSDVNIAKDVFLPELRTRHVSLDPVERGLLQQYSERSVKVDLPEIN